MRLSYSLTQCLLVLVNILRGPGGWGRDGYSPELLVVCAVHFLKRISDLNMLFSVSSFRLCPSFDNLHKTEQCWVLLWILWALTSNNLLHFKFQKFICLYNNEFCAREMLYGACIPLHVCLNHQWQLRDRLKGRGDMSNAGRRRGRGEGGGLCCSTCQLLPLSRLHV